MTNCFASGYLIVIAVQPLNIKPWARVRMLDFSHYCILEGDPGNEVGETRCRFEDEPKIDNKHLVLYLIF